MTSSPDEGGSTLRQSLHVPGKYMSLTTYRRDGSAASTGVWFAEEDGCLYVITPAQSHKAKRLRRNPAAAVAPSDARGRPKGPAIPARVEFLPPEEWARIDRLMADKYRIRRRLIMPVYRLVKKLRGHPIDEHGPAYLAISAA